LVLKDLNPQEFAKNLAQQATGYVPGDINEECKNYIVKKVHEFCLITGDHLKKNFAAKFSDEQAVIIIQFIGEWTFHKAIDIIRSGLQTQYWDQILQQVAFSALKAAIHANLENFEQAKAAAFIENNVMSTYEECIKQLVKANVITEAKVKDILSYSNVDKMAQEAGGGTASTPEEEEKTLKYATIAIVLKQMPKNKVNSILEKLGHEEREKILSCLKIEDIENKLDSSIIDKYLKELKKNLCIIKKPSSNEIVESMKKLQSRFSEEEIINLTLFERSEIQRFISDCLFEKSSKNVRIELSSYIAKIVYGYLSAKLVSQR
jgi:hypothetical protein